MILLELGALAGKPAVTQALEVVIAETEFGLEVFAVQVGYIDVTSMQMPVVEHFVTS